MINFDRISLGILAGVIILFYLKRVCTKQRARNLEVYQALSSPSVRNATSAFDKRVALATREAAKGFRLCAGCGFENVQRGASCVLCGASMEEKTKGLARFFGREKEDTTSSDIQSSRQRRIRRRKEWTRHQRRGDGTIVWRHEDPEYATHETRDPFPSYTLQAEAPQVWEPEVLNEPSSPRAPDHVAIDVDKPEVEQHTCNSTKVSPIIAMTPVIANDGDEVVFPSEKSAQKSRTLDSVRDSQLDFPTKLAHFISATASLFKDTAQEGDADEAPVSRFHVLRGSLVTDSVEAIASLTVAQSRGAIRVDFAGEQGIDAGGVYREWVQLLNQAMVTPEAGIFTCVNSHDQVFYLNPHTKEVLGEDYLAHFLAAGRLLGRALLEGNVTGFHLALPLLKIILGLPVGFDDLEFYDPDVHKNLKWLLDNDGVDALCLDFTVTETLPSGTTRIVELVPGGSEIELTDENKREYVDRKLKYLLFESVSSQLSAFLQGIYEVVPLDLLMVFDAEELDYVLSGSDEIDVDDWEAHTLDEVDTSLTGNRMRLMPCYDNFWDVVRELSVDERRRLLQFTTGSTRPPPGGFGSLTSYDGRLSLFTLRGIPTGETHGNLRSHACFNRLDLPNHRSLARMRAAVQAAISGDVEGFTID